MNKLIVAGAAVLAIAGSTAVYAQYRPEHRFHMRMNSDDMSAFADARIAAVKAGLRLTPDQEKMWPAVEAAVRDFARQRIDRSRASGDRRELDDPLARLRDRADAMAATATGLKKIVDAADPLYKTLDDSQKRRLAVLTRMGRGGGWGHRDHERRDGDLRPGGFERGDRPGRAPQPGPERL